MRLGGSCKQKEGGRVRSEVILRKRAQLIASRRKRRLEFEGLTGETRGRSQVKKEIKARRTLASCTMRQVGVKSNVRLCTSSPINLVHAPMSDPKDDSINSGWDSNSSRKPSNASMSRQIFIKIEENLRACLSSHYCCGASIVLPSPRM